MALFKSGNPALQEKAYDGTIFQGLTTGQEMTIKGTINKFGILFMLMFASTLFAWTQFQKARRVTTMPPSAVSAFSRDHHTRVRKPDT